MFSQNDEDGAIEDVFKHIGTTNKVRFDQEIWQNGRKSNFNGKKRDWTQISMYQFVKVTIFIILTRCTLNLVWRIVSNATHDTSGM